MARGAGGPAGAHPRLAGRYRLEERLSEQGGSSVYRATDEILARPVAVRTFAPGFGRVREVVAAARAACRINDPRLAKIFDADDRPEHAYIVSEWPSGVRLDDQLATGPLGPLRAAEIVAEAADALAAAHASGLAHLCLTPDVLWWTATGDV
ncbi:MAG: serine/threonine protein kinase, partial [Micromonosporaceae bacterium]